MAKIRINENQLHNIIKKTIISVLNEEEIKPGSTFKISPQLGADKMIKMISDKHGINPKDLIVQRDEILYKPKRKYRKQEKSVLSKPDEMEIEDFADNIVIPNMLKKGKSEFANIDGEVWLPLPNKGRYFGGELDPSEIVEVSNMGRVRIINCANAMKSKISKGYFAPTRGAVQMHINSTDAEGKPLKTTGFVANMVFDAFVDPDGELDPNEVKVTFIDGNPRNCRLDNLDFEIGKKRGRR